MRARRRQTRESSGVRRDLRADGRGSVRRDGPGHGAAGAHASLISLPPLHPPRHADPSARGPKGPMPVLPALPALPRQSRPRTHCVAGRRMAPAHEGGGCLVSARLDGRQRSQLCIVRRLRCSDPPVQIARKIDARVHASEGTRRRNRTLLPVLWSRRPGGGHVMYSAKSEGCPKARRPADGQRGMAEAGSAGGAQH